MRNIQILLVVLAALVCLPFLQPVAAAGSAQKIATSASHSGSGSNGGGSHVVAHPAGSGSGGGGKVAAQPGGSTGGGPTVAHPAPGYGGGYHGGYGGYHGGYHGGYYGGYHGYYGYPYYGWGLGWGWGWGGWAWGAPYYSYPYYSYPYDAASYYGYGEVRTEIKPNKAQVFIDGGFVGMVDSFDGWWQRLNVEPGTHRLVFRAPGFAPYVVDLRILPGVEYQLKYQMQPGDDNISEQDMLPKDTGDRRRDDDRYQDRGPSPYPDQDRDSDRAPNPNYDPRRPSERYNHGGDVTMQPQQNSGRRQMTLQVQPADATVYIDGTYYGTSDGGQVQVTLGDGPHKIEVVRPGYESFEKDIQVNENSVSSMTIMLQKK